MATTFDVTKKGVLEDLNEIVMSANLKSLIQSEWVLKISDFPTSWEEFDVLTERWRNVINFLSKHSPKPFINFIVAINVHKIVYDDRPTSFNWKQYEDPEIFIDCGGFSGWLPGCDTNDDKKLTKYLDLIVAKRIFDSNTELRSNMEDTHFQIEKEISPNQKVEYFLPLGQIIQIKFGFE